MISYATSEFWDLFWKLPAEIRQRARQTYRQFERNPNHSSLHFKRVKGFRPPVYSVRISKDYRALAWQESDNGGVWYWIGTYNQVR